ncbi:MULTISPECIES: TetR/AcrR family transcriptional regulator [Rhodopseudomonas]|uniref:TetR family transcriptional regulator n=1 Tax=Rhodopseudomonas palustris TaxID=1076 RepID=A0A0D7EHE2_RHOPL|nr:MULTISPECIES: TetR/AcrR family transcriptional regulator [Rhodopseudomonas]KIZ38947.1 TetR family transcriptional regulator [Rhodopseudomonas palustris]MDF3811817.1 TetR family transcriptional regulator [Rhodopseudomonas sp. BAL398]WOK20286.1 TetR family transcriptional regulator [Rhodopseudomonas sp. BAL398]
MRRHPDDKPGVATRDRILDAAVRRFSRHSYEATGLRDIAADVGIDVAYVHRCFGSKERLFAAALATTVEPAEFLDAPAADLAATLAKLVFARDAARDPIGPLDMVIHSLSSPEASRVLRQFIVEEFIVPLAGKLEQPSPSRAALIAATLVGLGILRNVLRIAPLQQTEGGDVEHLIAGAITAMIGADPGGGPA